MFNHDYPDKEINTTSTRFLRSQLEAMGLDTILQCTESLEQSYISPPYHIKPTRDRSRSDNIDFVFVIPVERLSANTFFFDGLDSGANTENITLKGNFITVDGHKIDIYVLLNRNNESMTSELYNRTPPVICLVSDTFFLFSSQNGGSVEYNTKETWNELFSKRYPEIYQRLMNAYTSQYIK
jgi:hypothetical protein